MLNYLNIIIIIILILWIISIHIYYWSKSDKLCPEPERCPICPSCPEKGACPKCPVKSECPPCPRPEKCPAPEKCPVPEKCPEPEKCPAPEKCLQPACPTTEYVLRQLSIIILFIVQFAEKLLSDPSKQSDQFVKLLIKLDASKWRHYHNAITGILGHIYLRSIDWINKISPLTLLFLSELINRLYKHLSKDSEIMFNGAQPRFSELNNDFDELLDVIVDYFQNYPNSEIISLKDVENDILLMFYNMHMMNLSNIFPSYNEMLSILDKTIDEYHGSVYRLDRDSFIILLKNGYNTYGFPYMNPENFNLQKIAEPGGKEYLQTIFEDFYNAL